MKALRVRKGRLNREQRRRSKENGRAASPSLSSDGRRERVSPSSFFVENGKKAKEKEGGGPQRGERGRAVIDQRPQDDAKQPSPPPAKVDRRLE